MPRVRVYPAKDFDEELLRKLLEQAGCPPTETENVDEEQEEAAEDAEMGAPDGDALSSDCEYGDDAADQDVLVVVLTRQTCADEALEGELKKAANSRCRVLCVWPPGTGEGASLPDVLKKYSGSEVPWDPAEVARVVCGGANVHKTSSGATRTTVETDRNCC